MLLDLGVGDLEVRPILHIEVIQSNLIVIHDGKGHGVFGVPGRCVFDAELVRHVVVVIGFPIEVNRGVGSRGHLPLLVDGRGQ